MTAIADERDDTLEMEWGDCADPEWDDHDAKCDQLRDDGFEGEKCAGCGHHSMRTDHNDLCPVCARASHEALSDRDEWIEG